MKFKRISRDELIYKATNVINNPSITADNSFYGSSEWKSIQNGYIKENPLCELCLNEGNVNKSAHVHHITPVSEGGDLFDGENLIALCKSCHSSIHSSSGVAVQVGLDLFGNDPLNHFSTNLEDINEDLIFQLKVGDAVKLVRERRQDNVNHVGVFSESREYIGSINSTVARRYYLAYDMDHGAKVSACILKIINESEKIKCVIEISKSDLDYKEIDHCFSQDEKAKHIIAKARSLEKDEPEKALPLYREAIAIIKSLDKRYSKYDIPWRHTKYPINRLSLVLERQKQYRECIDEIVSYENYDDKLGLYVGEKEKIDKRKRKVMKLI